MTTHRRGWWMAVLLAALPGCCKNKDYKHDVTSKAASKSGCDADQGMKVIAQINEDITDCETFCGDQGCDAHLATKHIDLLGGCWLMTGPPQSWEGHAKLNEVCVCAGGGCGGQRARLTEKALPPAAPPGAVMPQPAPTTLGTNPDLCDDPRKCNGGQSCPEGQTCVKYGATSCTCRGL